ncbi:unnamed protein product, partial [Polarella glacialis]
LAAVGVAESETGTEFPETVNGQELVATGAKSKFGGIKVYSVGFYLDKKCRLWGKRIGTQQLTDESGGKATLRMVVASSLVTRSMLVGKLKEKIGPRLQLTELQKVEVLATFERALKDGPTFGRGTVLHFACNKAGVEVRVGDRHKVEVKSSELARALLAAYLDGDATLPAFREDILSRVAAGLQSDNNSNKQQQHQTTL